MGLDKSDYTLLQRAVEALELLAKSQERVANHLDKQSEESAGFRKMLEGAIPGPLDSPADENGFTQLGLGHAMPTQSLEEVAGPPTMVDWFVDERDKSLPIHVRFSDGTSRKATEKEIAKLK